MFYYIKPEKRLLYIMRNLKQDEIDYEKIAIDGSIPLKIDFFKNNWREFRFEVLLTALSERFTVKEVRDFISTTIPRQMIFDNLIYFVDKDFIKYIKGVDLNKPRLDTLYAKLDNCAPVALARFVNQGNLDHLRVFRFMFNNPDTDWNKVKQFLKEVNNEEIFKAALKLCSNNPKRFNRKQLAHIEEIYYSKYPYVFEQNLLPVKYNINLKGVLWIKSIWHGLRNIVQKISMTLFSLTK